MKKTPLLIALYGTLVLVGGLIGFLKAHSLPSLIMGSVSAIALFIGSMALHKGNSWGKWLSLSISALLALFFGYRLILTHGIFPAGVMFLLSAALFLYLLKRPKTVEIQPQKTQIRL